MAALQAGHQVTLLKGTPEYFAALVAAIDASRHEVRFETYIFNLQASGEQVADALVRAAQRGVAVFLVVDGIGTPAWPPPWPQRFDAAGVQWHIFLPLGRFGLLLPSHWRRLHRKLCVVDGQVAFCGGINVLDDWIDPNYGQLSAPRFDFAVQVRGPLVQAVHAVMAQFWWRLQASQRARQVDWPAAWQALQQARQAQTAALAGAVGAGAAKAELVLRDNLRNRSRIERAYLHAIGEARHDIILANAYFLPGRKMRKSLIYAARRGIRVRLLLQGRYEYFMQYHAAHALYTSLLAAGVEIYEYGDSFMHAKVAVIDDQWATVGSSNIDPLSLLLAREANVVVHDSALARLLSQQLQLAMTSRAQRVDALAHAGRPWGQRWRDRLALLIMRSALFLMAKRY